MDYTSVILAISAAILSGVGTAIIAGIRDVAKERNRRAEREQDHLKIDLRDLNQQLINQKEYKIYCEECYNAEIA
jgi:MFS superfamily sulfate permease-like transporter